MYHQQTQMLLGGRMTLQHTHMYICTADSRKSNRQSQVRDRVLDGIGRSDLIAETTEVCLHALSMMPL